MPERSRQVRRLREASPASATARAAGARCMPAQRPSQAVGKTAGGRKRQAQARRQAILEAALAAFAARGYEAARLDDVAAQAGVAKGTLYLYFKDKQALFEELVRGAVTPIMDRVSAAALAPNMRAAQILELFLRCFGRRCWAPTASCCCA
jgi:AcrR family transcriptional regulator